MRRLGFGLGFLLWLSLSTPTPTACLGAAPAAPSHHPIEMAIERIRKNWEKPGAATDPNASGWNSLFDVLQKNWRSYVKATNSNERLLALNELQVVESALSSVSWPPAIELREGLTAWLGPRLRLVDAERKLVESVKRLPSASSDATRQNRELWVQFVESELDRALQSYDAATTVVQRQEAIQSIHESRKVLDARNREAPWPPSVELEIALDAMFLRPNASVRVDLPTLAPTIERDLIPTGPVERKGYVALVTAGPKSGFGLLPSDDSIVFFNRQLYSTATELWDFQRQLASDPRGARAAGLYQFQATTFDNAELTITASLCPSGLSLMPSYRHDVNALITSSPNPKKGAGVRRTIGAIAGFDQEAITDQVRQNAIPKMRAKIEEEAMEQGLEKTALEAATRNQALSAYLIGNGQGAYGKLLVDRLSMSSGFDGVLVGGTLGYQDGQVPYGADAPRPRSFALPDPGVSADLHLTSILNNVARGYLASDTVKSLENVMLVTRPRSPGAPLSEGFKITRNVDDATYFRTVETARSAGDSKGLALRVRRPDHPPEFAADASGNLVAIVRDFEIEVPYSAQAGRAGGVIGLPPAKVLRIRVPRAEITIAIQTDPATADHPFRLSGRIEGFEPGTGLQVFALNDETEKPAPLNTLRSALVIGFFRQRIIGQTIGAPLSSLPLGSFAIRSVSPLDPSGWIRLNLSRASDLSASAGR